MLRRYNMFGCPLFGHHIALDRWIAIFGELGDVSWDAPCVKRIDYGPRFWAGMHALLCDYNSHVKPSWSQFSASPCYLELSAGGLHKGIIGVFVRVIVNDSSPI